MDTRSRRGLSLVELTLAALILFVVGGALIQSLITGAQSASRAGESQVAALAGARAMDQLLALGYPALAASAGTTTPVDLGPDLAVAAEATITRVDPELVHLALTLTWQPAGTAAAGRPLTMRLFRTVADPACSQGRPVAVGGI